MAGVRERAVGAAQGIVCGSLDVRKGSMFVQVAYAVLAVAADVEGIAGVLHAIHRNEHPQDDFPDHACTLCDSQAEAVAAHILDP